MKTPVICPQDKIQLIAAGVLEMHVLSKMTESLRGRLKREGTYVSLWQIHADVLQKPTQHCNYLLTKNK